MDDPNDKKPLKPSHQRFADGVASGKTGKAAAQAAFPNQSEESAEVTASRLMRDPRVVERIAQRIEDALDLTENEVIGTLASMMRFDPTDVLREDGTVDLPLLKELRMGHCLKKFSVRVESVEVVEVEGIVEDEEPRAQVKRVDVISVEFHSPLAAATQVCKVLGLEQQARENDKTARARQHVAKAIERVAQQYFKGDVTKAKKAYLSRAPEHKKYVM
jgi:phage terminase small subunit